MSLFPLGKKQVRFLVIAIDYFTKQVEIEPLVTITKAKIQSFVLKNIVSRFRITNTIISNNGKQFDNPMFRKFCQDLGIKNHYSSPRLTNRSLLKIIKTQLERANGTWPKELLNVLQAYMTMTRVPTGETPFKLTFV